MIFETQDQLDAALAKWQKILRLQDWEIEAHLVPENRMPSVDTYGNCFPRIDLAWAEVCINEVRSMCNGDTNDHECVLVHELLHVAMVGFTRCIKKGSTEYELWEGFTQKTAQTLVALDRKGA